MNGAARMSLEISETSVKIARAKEANEERSKMRVHVFAENTLLQEKLPQTFDSEQEFEAIREDISEESGQRKFASNTPGLKVLLVGTSEKESDFLQYVSGGMNGFGPRKRLREK